MPPAVLQVDDALAANIGHELDADALEAAILEEEAWLARRIGPLVGERTQRFPLSGLRPLRSEITLQRPTDEVAVELDGADITDEVELRPDGRTVARLPEATRLDGVVEVTYTPTDELEVRRALKELLGLTLSTQANPGLASETMGSYAYQRATGASTRVRKQVVRDLMAPARPGSTRLLSSVPHGTAGALGR